MKWYTVKNFDELMRMFVFNITKYITNYINKYKSIHANKYIQLTKYHKNHKKK